MYNRRRLSQEIDKYQILFESIDEAFCIIKVLFDKDGRPINYRFLEVNPAFKDQTGLEDAEGKTIRELFPDYEEEIWFEIYADILKTGEPTRFERYSKAVDKYFDVYAFRYGSQGCKEVAILFKDITQRKKNENINAWLSAVVGGSSDAIISKDLNGTITSWNASAEYMFGYSAEEAVGQNITIIIPDGRLDEEKEILQKLRRGERIDHFETVRQRKDGNRLNVSLTVSPVRNSEDEIVGASKVARDITEQKNRKELDQYLLKLNETMRLLYDTDKIKNEALLLLREQLRADRALYIESNSEEDKFSITNNCAGEIASIEGQVNLSDFGSSIKNQLQNGNTYSTSDIPANPDLTEKEKERFQQMNVQAKVAVPLVKKSQLTAIVAAHQEKLREWTEHEITLIEETAERIWAYVERARAEEKLIALKESLEDRVEKRTAALKAYQNQLRSLASKLNKAEEEERRRLGTELHDNLGQMLAVAKMKLNFLQTTEASSEIKKEVVDLSEIIQEALTYTRELMTELKPPPVINKDDVGEMLEWLVEKMAKYNLKVTIQNGDRPKPLSDEMRITLYQCVKELLFNVIKHAETDEARITVSQEEDMVRVEVKDEGRGYNRQKHQEEPADQGGLGLFNISERMDFLGGSLDVISEPGKGTNAILYAPLAKKEVSDTAAGSEGLPTRQPSISKTGKNHKIKVLLVDDHEMVRRGFRKLIEEESDIIIVAEAADGEEAVTLAKETSPDIIIMDVNMPVMDGIEATQKITSDLANVRVIGLSLHDREEVIRSMKNAGAVAYLTKDEAFETLCATIRSEAVILRNNK